MRIYSVTPVFGATNIVAATTARNLVSVRGYFRGGVDAWLQFHDAAALPSNGAVPMKSFQLMAALDYFKSYDPDPLLFGTGIVICVSTTEGTLTISSALADFMVELEDTGFVPIGTSVAGDLVTGRDSLTPWTNAAGPKNLVQIDWTNGDNAVRYLMLFGRTAGVADGDKPLMQWKATALQAQQSLTFGDDGMTINEALAGTNYVGCQLKQSSTATVLTATSSAASYIKATYK